MAIGSLVRARVGRGLRRAGERARPEPDVLQRRLAVAPDWRREEDGHAVRLSSEQTIAVTHKGRWRDHDPLAVAVGWWPPRRAAGLVTWAAAVGLGWWAGRRHGRGPLATLHAPDSGGR